MYLEFCARSNIILLVHFTNSQGEKQEEFVSEMIPAGLLITLHPASILIGLLVRGFEPRSVSLLRLIVGGNVNVASVW